MTWMPVLGYEGQYEVSDIGEVRSVNGRVLKQVLNDQGYALVRVSGPRKILRVHRMVAEAFIPNPNNLPFVNHIDCVRDNNCAANLEWCTQWQNLHHSHVLGRMQRDYWSGRRSPNATLANSTVEQIRTEYAKGGISWAALAKKYGTNKRTVGRIVSGESYV